jgi:hypothetical protein
MESPVTVKLPLFETDLDQSFNEEHLVGAEQVITPAVGLLEKVGSESLNLPSTTETSKSINDSLNEMFPEQQRDEKELKQSKEILGELAAAYKPEQLKDAITEIKFLTETWLDDFEREIFQGRTLKELLHEKGGQ